MNGNNNVARAALAALIGVIGWLCMSVIQIQANRITAEDAKEIVTKHSADALQAAQDRGDLWQSMYRQQAQNTEILRRLTRIEEKLDK